MKKFALGVFTGWLATQACIAIIALKDEEFGDALAKTVDKTLGTDLTLLLNK